MNNADDTDIIKIGKIESVLSALFVSDGSFLSSLLLLSASEKELFYLYSLTFSAAAFLKFLRLMDKTAQTYVRF